MPREGTILYGILKSLTLTRSTMVTKEQRAEDRRLCAGARLIPLYVARQAFGEVVMPEADEDTVKKRFSAAFISNRKAGIAHYHGKADTGINLGLPELVADVS